MPLGLAAAFLAVFFATLGHYGITWDEPENFYTGMRQLRFMESGDYSWLRFPKESRFVSRLNWSASDGPLYTKELDAFRRASAHDLLPGHEGLFVRRELTFAYPCPPVANVMSAFTDQLFHEWLGLLDPIPAHHAAIGLLWAGFLVAGYRFTRKLVGTTGALVAAGTLAVAPRLWGPLHNNIKDIPEAAFFGFALMALYTGVSEDRPGWILAGGALGGLAVGTKLNGGFVFVVATLWLLCAWRTLKRLRKPTRRALWCTPIVAALAFFATWPYLWSAPLTHTMWALRYGLALATSVPSVPFGYAIAYVAVTTPLVAITLALTAIPRLWRLTGMAARPGALLILWAAIPILRVTIPGSGFYDGIRQFTEFWPALAIVAGIGACQLTDLVYSHVTQPHRIDRFRKHAWLPATSIAIAVLGSQIFSDVRLHPYEDTYFNRLVGGPVGADRRGIRWATDYWGNSYLQWVQWANGHLEPGSVVVAPVAGFLVSYDGLRPDISVTQTLPHTPLARPTYLVYITRKEYYNAIGLYGSEMPFYEIGAEGLPILKTYRVK